MDENAHTALGVGSMIGGRYRLDRLLGARGMSAHWEAVSSDGARCAVRVLDARLAEDRELVDRFVREASSAKRIKSEHVVEVREVAVDEATHTPFVTMELLDGYGLDALIARVGPLRPAVAVRVILQAARGFSAAHAEGIDLRDLEPSDIFLQRAGDSRFVVKVTDVVVKSTKSGASEVRSLGVALWLMLTGRMPSASEDPGSLTAAAPWVEPALAELVLSMLGENEGRPTLAAVVAWMTPLTDGRESIEDEDLRPSSELRSPSFGKNPGSPTGTPTVHLTGSENDSEKASLIGETLGGKYRLDRMLGHGGMGAVYEAVGPDKTAVAVKVVLGDHRKPDSLRRFVREARTMTAIESPNVVRVLDVDGDNSRGVPFIVMELLHGTDLEQTIRNQGALEPDVVARLFVQACMGLSAAHERGVVHRDIKPANIFLHREVDGRITTKICDFGIAKQLQSERDSDTALNSTDLTHTGSMIGSPPYMSPEQARSSKDIDARSDVWSLGVALYEALSGKRLWEGRTSLGELMAAIIREPVPRLEDVAPWVDPGLAAVVGRSLEKDPALRFPTMKAFAEALEPYALAPESFVLASLRSVSSERRSAVPHVASSRRVGETSASFATSGALPPVRPRPMWLGGVALLIALATAGGIAAIVLRAPAPATTAPTSAAPPASTSIAAPSTPTAQASVVPSTSAQPAIGTTSAIAASASAIVAPSAKPVVAPKPTAKKKPNEDPNVPNIF
ncbi:MAG: serine/threonine-protein kinase [Polyangiales bacterium]